jgi:hypothetical protein
MSFQVTRMADSEPDGIKLEGVKVTGSFESVNQRAVQGPLICFSI